MNIVEAPRPLMPIQPFKRKRSGSDAKEGDPAAEDIKPDRKALIAARVKDLEVSGCLGVAVRANGIATAGDSYCATERSRSGGDHRSDGGGFGQ